MMRLLPVALAALLAASNSPAAQIKPATPAEESRMSGRLIAAIEDVGEGYTREGLVRFVWINKELERREYSLWTRWTAHRWYAQALLDSGKPQKALDILQNAEREAVSLANEKQKQTATEETAKLIQTAREQLAKK